MSDLADEVFLLCLAVAGGGSGSRPAAEAAAATALRRGGWSRTMALGHGAREAAGAARPGPDDPGPVGPGPPVPAARWLAAGQPAHERAVLHLADRCALHGARLARALGVPEGEAAEMLAAAAGAWSTGLDPALMAWLGPGDCRELAGVMSGAGPEASGREVSGQEASGGEASRGEASGGAAPGPLSARAARDLAPAVSAHVADCPACGDRLRAMANVRDLLARDPGPTASPGLRSLARTSRARPPTPLGGPTPPARRRRSRLVAGGIGLAVAGAGAVAYLAWPSGGPATPTEAADAALSRLPPGGSVLVLDPPATGKARLHLSDVGTRTVTWQATSTAPWLRVAPATGRLVPGQSVQLDLDVVGTSVAGLRATVTVNGSDGSVAVANYVP